jgi:hypothetical protein
MNKLVLVLTSGLLLFAASAAKAQGPLTPHNNVTPAGTWRIVEGVNTAGNYQLFGGGDDNVLLRNSRIGGSLLIDSVSHVYVQGNKIGSIWIPGNNATIDVTIDGNEVTGGLNDCINVNDGGVHPINLVIKNNQIHHCGLAHPGNPNFHGIYVQVPGVVVDHNHLWDINAAISIRSSGTVTRNYIEGINCGGAIEYFADHDAAPGQPLIIRNNAIGTIMHNCPVFYGTRRGLIIIGNSIGTKHLAVYQFLIDYNVLEVRNTHADASGIYDDIYTPIPAPGADLIGNRMLNMIPTGIFIGPNAVGSEVNDSRKHH